MPDEIFQSAPDSDLKRHDHPYEQPSSGLNYLQLSLPGSDDVKISRQALNLADTAQSALPTLSIGNFHRDQGGDRPRNIDPDQMALEAQHGFQPLGQPLRNGEHANLGSQLVQFQMLSDGGYKILFGNGDSMAVHGNPPRSISISSPYSGIQKGYDLNADGSVKNVEMSLHGRALPPLDQEQLQSLFSGKVYVDKFGSLVSNSGKVLVRDGLTQTSAGVYRSLMNMPINNGRRF